MNKQQSCSDFHTDTKQVTIIGAGLAGSEAALSLADRGFHVTLKEMRPSHMTPVHTTSLCAELVCSNSLKSTKPTSAAGMLKEELTSLGSRLFEIALQTSVPAGGALAVDREKFAQAVTAAIQNHPNITLIESECTDIAAETQGCDAVLLAAGPMASDVLATSLANITGSESLAFFDAAAPIVMADSLDYDKLFLQSRYEDTEGDYINAPFSKEEYENFIRELVHAQRVIQKDFETKELFQACQPIEEIARKGFDAPRFGPLKPVGLTDPKTGKRPWAALQLRAENAHKTAYNLVGFQTNLTFPEQKRVFQLIPGLEHAEFARYGVMHRNTFVHAPTLLDNHARLHTSRVELDAPVYLVGQIAGTEGYCEAIRSGLHGALAVAADLEGKELPILPEDTAFGALLAYATNPMTTDYQPMHVNFGIMNPLETPIRQKQQRYEAYARRGSLALAHYKEQLQQQGLLS